MEDLKPVTNLFTFKMGIISRKDYLQIFLKFWALLIATIILTLAIAFSSAFWLGSDPANPIWSALSILIGFFFIVCNAFFSWFHLANRTRDIFGSKIFGESVWPIVYLVIHLIPYVGLIMIVFDLIIPGKFTEPDEHAKFIAKNFAFLNKTKS